MKYLVSDCPVLKMARPLDSQWAFPLLAELKQQAATFSELKTSLKPITSRMLSACLQKALEAECIELRDKKYNITSNGERLLKILKPLTNQEKCSTCKGKSSCCYL